MFTSDRLRKDFSVEKEIYSCAPISEQRVEIGLIEIFSCSNCFLNGKLDVLAK